jgi:hypothetical protein
VQGKEQLEGGSVLYVLSPNMSGVKRPKLSTLSSLKSRDISCVDTLILGTHTETIVCCCSTERMRGITYTCCELCEMKPCVTHMFAYRVK